MNDCSKIITVKAAGIESLVNASHRRKDGKHTNLKRFKELKLHSVCRSSYLREVNIKNAQAERSKSIAQARKRQKVGREFDFSSSCFFCGNNIYQTEIYKKIKNQLTVDNILEQLKMYEKTEKNKNILSRLCTLKDKNNEFYNNETVYYHGKCMKTFYAYNVSKIVGRPCSDIYSNLTHFIINYITDHCDECQFSMKFLIEEYRKSNEMLETPRLDRIEDLLKKHFESEIIIHSTKNDKLICFQRTMGKVIEDKWYADRENNEKKERKRIVDLAANIILQDIRASVFDIDTYKSPSTFLDDVEKDVPESLKLFLDILIKSHKHTPKNGSWDKYDKKICAIGHIIISAVRPRSFISPLLLGLSTMIHSKYVAKNLIDALHNISLIESYSETERFEKSIVNDPEKFTLIDRPFIQFVSDNADHNTATIDGKKTWHCMGNIMCVTPGSSVQSNNKSYRLKKNALPSNNTEIVGYIPLAHYQTGKKYCLDNIIVSNINLLYENTCNDILKPLDLIWLYGKHSAPQKTANWHGFMNSYHTLNKDYSTSKIIPLPFVNSNPSDYETIVTTLIFERKKATENGQKICFVTFDLPLYKKACEILASVDKCNDPHNLQNVIARLGGFHLLMSFLGSIGYIMEGSGLLETFSQIYATLSAGKALLGHAFSRAVRGHILTLAALGKIIFENIDLTESEQDFLNKTLSKLGTVDFETFFNSPDLIKIHEKCTDCLKNFEKKGPTAKLWLQYMRMISLVLQFIDAERSGNFKQHLQIVQEMIPIFFAAGRHLYAKYSILYLQNMRQLNTIMDVFEYDNFVNKGYFTIRRSDRFWSGVWSDMTIEQVLMRSIKCMGGLTHGRGLTEKTIMNWILSRVVVMEVCSSIESYCNVQFSTSEQHVDNRISRISRDYNDLLKLNEFFKEYPPFLDTDFIISIVTGVKGHSSVNCFEVGKKLMDDTAGKIFTKITYKKSTKIKNLMANSTIKNLNNEDISISSLQILQRLTLNITNKDDMKEFVKYELTPTPLSLFNGNEMRKTTKSDFYTNFKSLSGVETKGSCTHVVDGGFFLHKVVWDVNDDVKSIISKYVQFACNHYEKNSFIIFDGYPEDDTLTTKSVERSRRKMKNIGRDVIFQENTKINMKPNQFLSSEKNKSRLIMMISQKLNEAGFRTKIAVEDADALIVNTAIHEARNDREKSIIIVGQDIDLLVIFYQLAYSSTNLSNIYFRKDGKAADPPEYFNNKSFKNENLQSIVGFLHAFTGCDTTSAFYKKGKTKLMNAEEPEKLVELAAVFNKPNATRKELENSAYKLICSLYSNKAEKLIFEKSTTFSLNDLRYLHYTKGQKKKIFLRNFATNRRSS